MGQQPRGELDTALLVRRNLNGIGEQLVLHSPGVRQVAVLQLGRHILPFGSRERHQAAIQPTGDHKGLSHFRAKAGREIQAIFGIQCVVVPPDEHPFPTSCTFLGTAGHFCRNSGVQFPTFTHLRAIISLIIKFMP